MTPLPFFKTLFGGLKQTVVNLFHWRSLVFFVLPLAVAYAVFVGLYMLLFAYLVPDMEMDPASIAQIWTWHEWSVLVAGVIGLIAFALYVAFRMYYAWYKAVLTSSKPNFLFGRKGESFGLFICASLKIFFAALAAILVGAGLFMAVSAVHDLTSVIVTTIYAVVMVVALAIMGVVTVAAVDGKRLSLCDGWKYMKGTRLKYILLFVVCMLVGVVIEVGYATAASYIIMNQIFVEEPSLVGYYCVSAAYVCAVFIQMFWTYTMLPLVYKHQKENAVVATEEPSVDLNTDTK